MAGEWQEWQIGELLDIKHGFAFKGEFFCDEPPGDVLLTPGNFAIGGGFKTDKLKYYTGPVDDEFVLDEGDVLVSMTDLSKNADTLGYPARIPISKGPHFLHNQRLGRIQLLRGDVLDKGFLYYLFCSREYRHEVVASATGTTVRHTSPKRIKAFKAILPPLSEQKRIAHILGTLDDKIDLNRRMNETLESMARAIFKSWFVDFDPVRAKIDGRQPPGMDAETAALFPDSFVESALGQIPKGWLVERLSRIAEVVMGTSPPGSTYNDDGLGTPLVNGPVEFGDFFPVKKKWTTAPTRFSEPHDLIFCVRGSTTGRRVISDDVYCLGRGVCAIRARDGQQAFVNKTLDIELDRMLSRTTGSVFPNLSAPQIKGFEILIPPSRIAKLYCRTVGPFEKRVERNVKESIGLAVLRDTLLPKLLCGDISVSEAEGEATQHA